MVQFPTEQPFDIERHYEPDDDSIRRLVRILLDARRDPAHADAA